MNLLVVLALQLLQLASQPLDLVLVLHHLRLKHVELGGHRLHLPLLLLQQQLQPRQLLDNLGTWNRNSLQVGSRINAQHEINNQTACSMLETGQIQMKQTREADALVTSQPTESTMRIFDDCIPGCRARMFLSSTYSFSFS
jgi:hypothetical protein